MSNSTLFTFVLILAAFCFSPTLAIHIGNESLPEDYACPICATYMPELLAGLAENSTIDEIAEAVSEVCKLSRNSSKQQQCYDDVQELLYSFLNGDVGVTYIFAKYSPIAQCSILGLCQNECCQTPHQPEQIHISLTGDVTTMAVSWVTLRHVQSLVRWGTSPDNMTHLTNGTTHTYTNAGWVGVIHEALMTDLEPDTTYYYQVGDPNAHTVFHGSSWSVPTTYFKTPPAETPPSKKTVMAVIGDMGATDASLMTVEHLVATRVTDSLDLLLHVGDISYADMDQRLWDDFMRLVEPIAAYIPYMVCAGNHEDFFNFNPYRNRFSLMPHNASNSPTSEYYSFDYGLAHIIAFQTEAPRQGLADLSHGTAQYQWLKEDLRVANLPENRAARPWIIVMGHRPLYCSVTSDASSCDENAEIFRSDIEDLLNENQVNLVINGHVHAYERTYPVYKSQKNSSAPVYIVNGAAGSKEQLDKKFADPPPAWSAAGYAVFGYGMITIESATSLVWEFYEAAHGTVIDSVTLSNANFTVTTSSS